MLRVLLRAGHLLRSASPEEQTRIEELDRFRLTFAPWVLRSPALEVGLPRRHFHACRGGGASLAEPRSQQVLPVCPCSPRSIRVKATRC